MPTPATRIKLRASSRGYKLDGNDDDDGDANVPSLDQNELPGGYHQTVSLTIIMRDRLNCFLPLVPRL